MTGFHKDLSGIQDLAAQGKTRAQIAEAMGVTTKTVRKYARLNGISITRAGCCGQLVGRNERMETMFRQGITLTDIGKQFGVTRERVRQILEKKGVAAASGGRQKRANDKRADVKLRRDAFSLLKYGQTAEAMKVLIAKGIPHMFRMQRRNAASRGIEWELSFAEWFSVWQTSGKLDQRGRGKGKYVMSRLQDDGPYALGNVHIQLSTENNSESRAKIGNKRAESTGVYCLYPGSARGWVAVYGGKKIGAFASEGEAVIARAEYLKSIGASGRPGRGYSVINSKYGPRYQVMVGRQYVGLYRDAEQALKARAEYLSAQAPSLPEPAKEGASHA